MFSLQITSLKCLYSHFLKKHLAPNPIRTVETQWRKQISALNRLCRGIPAFLPLTPWCGWRLHGQPRLLPSSSSNKTILILLMDWCMGRPMGESSQSPLPVVLKSPPPTMVSVGTTWGAGIQPYLQGHVARQYPHSYFKEIMVEEDIPSHNLIQKYIEKVSQS